MENKLELKHLAPYLPYGVQFMGKRVGYVHFDGGPMFLSPIDLDGRFEIIKPLLIPLSELNGQEYVDFAEWVYGQQFEVFDDIHGAFRYLESLKNKLIGDWPYAIVTELISKHYDVFGLLEAGLALNKLTYNTTDK